jgi:hypothetical protein
MNQMQHRADSVLESRLDSNDYNEASLIELKVPLDLPYQNDWEDFERYDGEITVDGQHYKYVKRKVQDGMLVLKCIPNESKHRIESARDQFFQLANDLQSNDGAKKSEAPKHPTAKNTITECEEFSLLTLATISSAIAKQQINGNKNCIVTRPHSSPEQPPEA